MADTSTDSIRDVYGKTLAELGKENKKIVVLDADLSVSTKTSLFAKAFPERFVDMGVSEQDMISVAAGLATTGKIVFASTFAVFATGRAWEQVRTSVCYPRLNVKVVATHGGITTGEDGVTHQATEDLALMRVLPNMTVVVPADGAETEKAIKAAVDSYGPFYIRLSRPKIPKVYKNGCDFKIGKGIVLSSGKDLTIVAAGIMVSAALEAKEMLLKDGIDARVIDMHTIKPLDNELIFQAARETGAIVTAEEHSIIGGLGSAVAEVVSENCPVILIRVGQRDIFAESGKPKELLEKYGMTSNEIYRSAKLAVQKKNNR